MTCILNNMYTNSRVSVGTAVTTLCSKGGDSQYLISEAVVSKEGHLASLTSNFLVLYAFYIYIYTHTYVLSW